MNLTVAASIGSFFKYSTTVSCKIKVWECISKVDDKETNSEWRVLKLCKSTFDFQVQKYLLHWLKIPRAFRKSRLLIKLFHVIILMTIPWSKYGFSNMRKDDLGYCFLNHPKIENDQLLQWEISVRRFKLLFIEVVMILDNNWFLENNFQKLPKQKKRN